MTNNFKFKLSCRKAKYSY